VLYHDCISVDSTFGTKRFRMPLVLFVGVDGEGRAVLLGGSSERDRRGGTAITVPGARPGVDRAAARDAAGTQPALAGVAPEGARCPAPMGLGEAGRRRAVVGRAWGGAAQAAFVAASGRRVRGGWRRPAYKKVGARRGGAHNARARARTHSHARHGGGRERGRGAEAPGEGR
jgi:hypothetical protein